jgi:hypothetical protein
MGTNLKGTVFTRDVMEGLIGWKKKAERNRARKSRENSESSSEDHSREFTENGSSKGDSTGDDSIVSTPTEGHSPHEVVVDTPPALPRENSRRLNHNHEDESLRKLCQKMYGKDGAQKVLSKAKVAPSGRTNGFTDLKEGEEEGHK